MKTLINNIAVMANVVAITSGVMRRLSNGDTEVADDVIEELAAIEIDNALRAKSTVAIKRGWS